MAPPKKVTATEQELKSFDWLPIEQWSVDTIINYYKVEEGHLCKLCDNYVRVSDLANHVKAHKSARLALKKKEKEANQKIAEEKRRLKREEKKRGK